MNYCFSGSKFRISKEKFTFFRHKVGNFVEFSIKDFQVCYHVVSFDKMLYLLTFEPL